MERGSEGVRRARARRDGTEGRVAERGYKRERRGEAWARAPINRALFSYVSANLHDLGED